MSSLLGTILGNRYRLESKLGSGGMSTVYLARDEKLERWVAVKVMNREVASNSDHLERFRREARAVARISHPNVVRVIDADEDDGRPYIVLEHVSGETLKAMINRLGRLEITDALACAIDIAQALHAAHANQIVHRDVKPDNVLIDQDGSARVTDFGIARTLEEQGLTADGRVLGTTDYVSPEQALGSPATYQSDLYSLGIVLYEMLTGEVPFSGENQVAVAMKHVREPLPDLRAKRSEVSPALAAVVARATAKDPANRYRDASTLITDLERLLAVELEGPVTAPGEVTAVLDRLPPQRRRPLPPAPRRRRTMIALVAAGLLAILAVALLSTTAFTPSQPHHRPTSAATPVAVTLCTACAHAYNPDGVGGTAQNNSQARYAVDGNPNIGWSTQDYYSGQLGKPGVGIYVEANHEVRATRLDLLTSTPQFSAAIYASDTTPDPNSFARSRWKLLCSNSAVAADQRFTLASRRHPAHAYRFFLVWITRLPPNHDSATVNRIRLYQ
ncbi:MAG: protein kinase domain-containing protein [Solirubrobacteraceae bacterium]